MEDRDVYLRDASFLASPGTARRYHLMREGATGPFGHDVALCSSRIMLNEDSICSESFVRSVLCRRCASIGETNKEPK